MHMSAKGLHTWFLEIIFVQEVNKKLAKLSINVTVVSFERMQLYSIVTEVASSTIVAKASTPHLPKW